MTAFSGRMLLRLAPTIYGPAVLFGLGKGCLVPMVPVIAVALGANLGQSGLIASMLVIGQLIGNLPAGLIVSRFGERVTMLLASVAALIGAAGVGFAPDLVVLVVAVFLIGIANAAYNLGRHAFMAARVTVEFRARALSLLGGSFRLGAFTGPFAAAGLLAVTDDSRSPVWAFMVALALAALLVGLGPDLERVGAGPAPQQGTDHRGGVWRAARENSGALARVGSAAAVLSGTRATRDVVLPLWGISLGLDAQHIALIVGVSGAIDFLMSYMSGQVMDRFGRIWAAAPSMVAMGASLLVLSLTHDVDGAVEWFLGCAIVLGLGNGLSGGMLLTLGADLAPVHRPAPLLAAWRTLTDTGGALTPLLVSGLAGVSLPAACATAGALSIAGAAAFVRWLPRYVPRRGGRDEGAEDA